MRSSLRLAGLFLLPLLFGLAGCQQAKLPLSGHAPAWKLKDLEGREVSSDQFKGKVVMLDFWATWCVPCVEEIPEHIKLQEKYAKDGFVLIGISLDETGPEHVQQFVKAKGMNYPVVMGKLDELEAIFGGLDGLPTKILIDRTGEIRDRKAGAGPADERESKVRALLK